GAAGTSPQLAAGPLATLPEAVAGAANLKSHPAAQAGEANVEAVRARERGLGRAYYPHITLQSTLAARGTGADTPGVPSFGNGLWLQVPNWAIGAQMTFPAFDIFSINARKKIEAQNELAESARLDQTIQT